MANFSLNTSLIDTLYRMSVIEDTRVKDVSLLKLSLGVHVLELVLLLVSIPPVTFLHYLVVESRIFHINVRFFIGNFLFVYYLQWLARMVTFVVAFARFTDDPSIFGPFRSLHIIHELGLVMGAMTYPAIAIDRLIATRWARWYEESTTPRLAIILVTISNSTGILAEVLKLAGSSSEMTLASLVGACSVFALVVLVFAYKRNKHYLKHPYTMNLSRRFQLRENVQLCLSLLPSLIISAVAGTVGAVLIMLAVALHFHVPSIILVGAFNIGLGAYFIICPISLIVGTEKYRCKALAMLHRRRTTVEDVFRRSPDADRDLYFLQLQSQWNVSKK